MLGSVDASLDPNVPIGCATYETDDRTAGENYRTDESMKEIRFNKFSF